MNVLILLFSWFGLFAGQGFAASASIGDGSGDCPNNVCGLNGTRMTGLVANVAGDFAAVTLPSGEVIALQSSSWPERTAGSESPPPLAVGGDCPRIGGCGLNGTLVDGRAVELDGDIRAVTLPSGDLVILR